MGNDVPHSGFAPFENLPNELYLYIFKNLTCQDLSQTGRVCKLWQTISADENLWRRLSTRWPHFTKQPNSSWKNHFKLNYPEKVIRSIIAYEDRIFINSSSDIGMWSSEIAHHHFEFTTLRTQHTGIITQLQNMHDHQWDIGTKLISSSTDGTIKVWQRVKNGLGNTVLNCISDFSPYDGMAVTDLKVLKNLILTASDKGDLKIWRQRPGGQKPTCLAASEESRGEITCMQTIAVDIHKIVIFTGSTDATIKVWHLTREKTLKVSQTLLGHDKAITCMAFGSREGVLISGSQDCNVKLWKADLTGNYRCIHTIKAHDGAITTILKPAFEHIFYTSSADKTIKAWTYSDLSKNCLLKEVYTEHEEPIACMRFGKTPHHANNENKICSVGTNGEIKIWLRASKDRRFKCINTIYGTTPNNL